jgi:hypothetical protein
MRLYGFDCDDKAGLVQVLQHRLAVDFQVEAVKSRRIAATSAILGSRPAFGASSRVYNSTEERQGAAFLESSAAKGMVNAAFLVSHAAFPL